MNKFLALKNAVTSRVGLRALAIRKHSPTMLFVAGTVGVVGTVVLACRATLKVEAVLNDHEAFLAKMEMAREDNGLEYTEKDFVEDRAKLFVKTGLELGRLYGPAIGVGVVSIACLTGAHVVLSRRNVNVAAAYALLDRAYREYRGRVQDAVGLEEERKLYGGMHTREIVEETDEGPVVRTIETSAGRSPYTYLFDKTTSQSWSPDPGYNQTFLRCNQSYANDRLRAEGFLLLNDVLDMLGMPRTKEGCVTGWIIDGGQSDNFVDFGVFEGDTWAAHQFVSGREKSIWVTFNVDGIIYDKLPGS